MAKKSVKSIWNVIEKNDDGETKVLTVRSGSVQHNIVVFTNKSGISTSAVVSGNISFPIGEIVEIPVGLPS